MNVYALAKRNVKMPSFDNIALSIRLIFSTVQVNSAGGILKIVFLFFPENNVDIPCKLYH